MEEEEKKLLFKAIAPIKDYIYFIIEAISFFWSLVRVSEYFGCLKLTNDPCASAKFYVSAHEAYDIGHLELVLLLLFMASTFFLVFYFLVKGKTIWKLILLKIIILFIFTYYTKAIIPFEEGIFQSIASAFSLS